MSPYGQPEIRKHSGSRIPEFDEKRGTNGRLRSIRERAMTGPETHRITRLLDAARGGDSAAFGDLLAIVYDELRQLAAGRMRRHAGGGAGPTLQPTALVHEAYLRLLGPDDGAAVAWTTRKHFFAAAATAMRDILVDRARQRASLKRGGDRVREDMHGGADFEAGAETEAIGVDLIALDAALSRLAHRDARKVDVVMLRYFAGLSVEETARSLELSPATVKREWVLAKALLYDELKHGDGNPS